MGSSLQTLFFTLSYLSADLHQQCLLLAPSSIHVSFYQALVCGSKVSNSPEVFHLQKMGIIHMLVVSGAHLLFLSKILKLLFKSKLSIALEVLILFIFVCICQFQIPVFRAWIFVVLKVIDRRLKLFTPVLALLLTSVVFCLSIFPDQKFSYTLLLSWLACLGISLGRNAFTQALWIFIFIYPIINSFNPIPLWTILINAFLTPMIGLVLFPLSALSFIIPKLSMLVDHLWDGLFFMASTFTKQTQAPSASLAPPSTSLLWVYALCLHFVILSFSIRKKKNETL